MLPFQMLLLAMAELAATTQTPPLYPPDGSDLFSFVSRPDIRAPRFNVSVYLPDRVTPGYLFTAPYGDLRTRLPTSLYQPGQVGPHVYDEAGELIWSGAHLFDDRPTFDFKVANIDGAPHLTFITNEDLHEHDSPGGSAILLDSSFRRVHQVEDRAGRGTMNMHEMNTVSDGRHALTITFESKLADLTVDGETHKTFVGNNGFSEVEINTGKPVFSWWALDHVDPSESLVERPSSIGSYSSPWDAFHINSVDKNGNGDYLVSARYTSTIYKISGRDGHIMWRLGGSKSDFALQGFNMSSQHDARFRSDNSSIVVITFFNNHSDGHHATAKTSEAMEVALDLMTGQAHVLHRWSRPDGGLTKLRGNAQHLDNDNMFVCWSENSYMSEHTSDGELVMEAQMASHRLVTYRAYKMNFTAQPNEPIALKAFVYGVDEESSTTVMYVSWNGATEVKSWAFSVVENGRLSHLGTADKTGFETTFMTAGASRYVVVEALDAQGESLGTSQVASSEIPSSWPVEAAAVQGRPIVGSVQSIEGATLEEETRVSEDISTRLHEASEATEGKSQSTKSPSIVKILTDPWMLVGIVTMPLFSTLLVLFVRRRRQRGSRPDCSNYKPIAGDA